MRRKGGESIEGENIRELEEEVGDTLSSLEESSTRTRGGRSRNKIDFRGTRSSRTENSLVSHLQWKGMVVEKIHPKVWNGERPVEMVRTKT